MRRPRQTEFGPVRIIYVEGSGAPYAVVASIPDVSATYGPQATLHACRLYRDAVVYCTSGDAERALIRILNQEAA